MALYGLLLSFVAYSLITELYLVHEQFLWLEAVVVASPALTWFIMRSRRQDRSVAREFVLAFLLMTLCFGALMAWSQCRGNDPEWNWLPFLMWKSFRWFFVGAGAAAIWAGWQWLVQRRRVQEFHARFRHWPIMLGLGMALLCCTTMMFLHCRLLLEFESGLTSAMVRHAWMQLAFMDFVRMVPPANWLALAIPVVLFLMAVWAYAKWRCGCEQLMASLIVVVAILSVLPIHSAMRPEITANPLQFFVADAFEELSSRSKAVSVSARMLPNEAQLRSVRLIDEAFVSTTPLAAPALNLPPRREKPWNILFFIMESTGASYVFDTTEGNAVPMPFLKQLSETGVSLRRHYATANSSAEAMFSLFTGIYPRSGSWAANDGKLHIPTLNRLLGPSYHSFFVHPVSMTMSFPKPVLVNNGLTELYEKAAIPSYGFKDPDPQARHESAGVKHLLEKIDGARQPFCAFYMSFVPHHPYNDYGKEYSLFPHSDSERHSYYNNLRVLDTEIRRIHTHLAKSGLLDDTILVFVGDHSEAFGQHLGVWKHCNSTYDEAFRTPMIFWQPKLFTPTTVERVTSHTDVLPTLLDAMGVPFNEQLVQGESLYRESHRRYVFLTSRFDDLLAAVDTEGVKLTVGFRRNNSYAFNVAKDPSENIQLPAAMFPAQHNAVLKFHNAQASIFDDYNRACTEGRPFQTTNEEPKRITLIQK